MHRTLHFVVYQLAINVILSIVESVGYDEIERLRALKEYEEKEKQHQIDRQTQRSKGIGAADCRSRAAANSRW